MKHHLAFVLPSLAGGGAERVLLQLAHSVDRRRFRGTLILLDGQGSLTQMIPKEWQTIDLRCGRLRRVLPKLIATLRSVAPNTVVSTFGYVNLAILVSRRFLPRGTRLVLRDANMPSLSLPEARFGKILKVGYKILYRRADTVICSSQLMADEFADDFGVPRSKIAVLPNPVDVHTIRREAVDTIRVPGHGLRFNAAGRFVRQKGFDRLLDIFAKMPKQAHLTILGDGPDVDAIASAAERLGVSGRVDLPGFQPAPWRYYAGADAFLLPSRWEGMPNAALEALACGTPVIATPEAGAITELAEMTKTGAITIADVGDPYCSAMRAISPRLSSKLRSSLLPDAFRLENVVRQFEAVLAA